VFRASGRVAVCCLPAALIVIRLRRAHRLALGALQPQSGRVSHWPPWEGGCGPSGTWTRRAASPARTGRG